MFTEEGIVENIQFKKTFVRLRKSGSCTSCESRGSCHALSDKEMLIEVTNDIQAREGDRVELSIPTRSLLKLSLLVYFLPVLMFVVGAVVGAQWAETRQMDSSLSSIIGGIVAMGGTFFLLKNVDRKARGKTEFGPRITRILSNADLPQVGDNK